MDDLVYSISISEVFPIKFVFFRLFNFQGVFLLKCFLFTSVSKKRKKPVRPAGWFCLTLTFIMVSLKYVSDSFSTISYLSRNSSGVKIDYTDWMSKHFHWHCALLNPGYYYISYYIIVFSDIYVFYSNVYSVLAFFHL